MKSAHLTFKNSHNTTYVNSFMSRYLFCLYKSSEHPVNSSIHKEQILSKKSIKFPEKIDKVSQKLENPTPPASTPAQLNFKCKVLTHVEFYKLPGKARHDKKVSTNFVMDSYNILVTRNVLPKCCSSCNESDILLRTHCQECITYHSAPKHLIQTISPSSRLVTIHSFELGLLQQRII